MSILDEYNSYREQKGANDAKLHKSPELATFLVNLFSPTENPQHKDLCNVEDYLHGYYGEWIKQLRQMIKELESRNRTLQARAEKAEEVLSAYKDRKAGPKRNKQAARTNR